MIIIDMYSLVKAFLFLVVDKDIFMFSVRDMAAGWHITVIRTYSADAEYFGRYDEEDVSTPQLASDVVHARDLMAKTEYGQSTWGAVHLGCPSDDE